MCLIDQSTHHRINKLEGTLHNLERAVTTALKENLLRSKGVSKFENTGYSVFSYEVRTTRRHAAPENCVSSDMCIAARHLCFHPLFS